MPGACAWPLVGDLFGEPFDIHDTAGSAEPSLAARREAGMGSQPLGGERGEHGSMPNEKGRPPLHGGEEEEIASITLLSRGPTRVRSRAGWSRTACRRSRRLRPIGSS